MYKHFQLSDIVGTNLNSSPVEIAGTLVEAFAHRALLEIASPSVCCEQTVWTIITLAQAILEAQAIEWAPLVRRIVGINVAKNTELVAVRRGIDRPIGCGTGDGSSGGATELEGARGDCSSRGNPSKEPEAAQGCGEDRESNHLGIFLREVNVYAGGNGWCSCTPESRCWPQGSRSNSSSGWFMKCFAVI